MVGRDTHAHSIILLIHLNSQQPLRLSLALAVFWPRRVLRPPILTPFQMIPSAQMCYQRPTIDRLHTKSAMRESQKLLLAVAAYLLTEDGSDTMIAVALALLALEAEEREERQQRMMASAAVVACAAAAAVATPTPTTGSGRKRKRGDQ